MLFVIFSLTAIVLIYARYQTNNLSKTAYIKVKDVLLDISCEAYKNAYPQSLLKIQSMNQIRLQHIFIYLL